MTPINWLALVEDDEHLRDTVALFLEKRGFAITSFADAESLFDAIASGLKVDIAILDVNLPGINGFQAAARCRALDRRMGIIIATARNELSDRLTGRSNGADTYLIKPFHLAELELSIHNLLSRLEPSTPVEDQPGTWTFLPGERSLITPSRSEINLTEAETIIMAALAQIPGQAVSRDALLAPLRPHARDLIDRTVDVFVSRLKKKVATATADPLPIKSVRHRGYTFNGHIVLKP